MKPAARVALFGGVALLALCGGFAFRSGTLAPTPDIRPLMAVSMPDLQGESRSVGEWRGNVLVVNFWATWCPPCLKEIPEFVRMQERLGGRGLQFIGIAADRTDKVRAFAAKNRMNYPVLLGEMDVIEIARLAGNSIGGLPFTVIIDRQGKWVRSESGALDEARLMEIVAPLL